MIHSREEVMEQMIPEWRGHPEKTRALLHIPYSVQLMDAPISRCWMRLIAGMVQKGMAMSGNQGSENEPVSTNAL